jgi:cobalt-zinc-cadmium efflux system protein
VDITSRLLADETQTAMRGRPGGAAIPMFYCGNAMTHDHALSARTLHGRSNRRRLTIALVLTSAYLVAEVIGGLLTNSLALLADAGHMLTDVAALGLALFAVWLVERPASPQRTYGYLRAEILAALINGAALLAVCGWIVIEAVRRLQSPPEILGAGMFAVASGGLVVNLLVMRVLHGAHSENLNLRAAWLHVLGDALGSVAVIVGALLVWGFGWSWADPVASIAVALLIVVSAWGLVAEATSVLMESAPRGLDVDEVRSAILATPGVAGLHDLHIWSITTGLVCLSVHVVAQADLPRGVLLRRLRPMLHERFGIVHTTIQVEPDDYEGCSEARCPPGEG